MTVTEWIKLPCMCSTNGEAWIIHKRCLQHVARFNIPIEQMQQDDSEYGPIREPVTTKPSRRTRSEAALTRRQWEATAEEITAHLTAKHPALRIMGDEHPAELEEAHAWLHCDEPSPEAELRAMAAVIAIGPTAGRRVIEGSRRHW